MNCRRGRSTDPSPRAVSAVASGARSSLAQRCAQPPGGHIGPQTRRSGSSSTPAPRHPSRAPHPAPSTRPGPGHLCRPGCPRTPFPLSRCAETPRKVDQAARHVCSVPEQGLPGAGRGLLGHLLVDVPGGHPDPQHGGQRGIVQQDAHLRGEVGQQRLRGPPPSMLPRRPCAPQGLGLSPPAPFASSGFSLIVTGDEPHGRARGGLTQCR